jgi:dihydrofolate reductase
VEWNNSHILRDVAKDVAALKNTDGGNILVYGSATLVKSLLHHDLIDELRLMLYPVSIDNGVLILEYQPINS